MVSASIRYTPTFLCGPGIDLAGRGSYSSILLRPLAEQFLQKRFYLACLDQLLLSRDAILVLDHAVR